MLYRSYKPPHPLGDFVDDLWLYDDYAQPHLKVWILPSGTIELVINLRENVFRIYDPACPERYQAFSGRNGLGRVQLDLRDRHTGGRFRRWRALQTGRRVPVSRSACQRIGGSSRRSMETANRSI